MRICVLGLGYIGLPTALLFANNGYEVVGVDINDSIVKKLNNGGISFEEPGLDELLKNANFTARTDLISGDIFIIAVPTPLNKEVKISDLKYVRMAADMISVCIKRGDTVVLESTVPPGTSEKLLIPILTKKLNIEDIYVAHCPERATPGRTLYEMVNNDRIIGGINKKSSDIVKEIYSCFIKGNMYLTDIRTAEFVKLMENTFRDTNIALANELAHIAEECGINIWEAIGLANKHPRVKLLNPGPGVGGHCIAVDPWFLTENSTKFKMISLAREINDNMPNFILKTIKAMLNANGLNGNSGNIAITNPTITILGVAYKGDVDDTRETPAIKLIKLAENEGYKIRCYDPYVKNFDYDILDLYDSAKDSDCIILITDHTIFKNIDPFSLKMRNKNLIDTRNILDHNKWRESGFNVKILGNGKLVK